MDYSKSITIEPRRRSGKACVRNTRITVSDVLDYMTSGMSQAEILADFPDLTETDSCDCLFFPAKAKGDPEDEFFWDRSAVADPEKFLAILRSAPDCEPDPGDELDEMATSGS